MKPRSRAPRTGGSPLGSRLAIGSAALASAALPAAAQLSYQEITGSIAALEWDGGRTELEFGDLNGDGQLDIATVGDHGSPFVNTQMHGITVWLGDGAGGWSLVQTGDFGYGGLALGDANGDGNLDVGFGVHHDWSSDDLGDQLLEVALGDGSASGWTPWDDGLATSGETWGMFACDFGDVDADGDLDLGSVSFGCCAGVHVYLNQGNGTWVESFGFLDGNSDHTFEFADLDGNGVLDVVVGHDAGSVYLGDGSGGFVPAGGNLPSSWLGVGAGDVDGDGQDELSFRTLQGGLEVWTWSPGDVWVSMSGNLPSSGDFGATQLADMDGDGLADLVAYADGTVVVAAWQPGDTWTLLAQTVLPGPASVEHEAMRAGGDLDHNGFADFAVVQNESTGIFSSQNVLYVMAEASVPLALEPRVVSPGPSRVWLGGQARFVDWTCAVPAGQTAVVDLELSVSGTEGPWTPIGTSLPNGGRHQWTVPVGVHSTTCRIRVTARTGVDEAQAVSAPFTIAGPASVTPHGCGVNPAGSLAVTAGAPLPGTSVTLAVDDPGGGSASPSFALVLVSLEPDPGFPCGTLLAGLGMSGPDGELLVGLTPPDPIAILLAEQPWTGAGQPVTLELVLPTNPGLVGLELYAQGVLAAVTDAHLTEALVLSIGST